MRARVMRRVGIWLAGVAAALAIDGAVAAYVPAAPDRVLGTLALDRAPALVVADARARRIVAFTDGAPWGGLGGPGGAMAHVLGEDGAALGSVPVDPRPAQALVDPPTGRIIVVTAAPAGAAGGFFSPGVSLSVLDPARMTILRTTVIPGTPPRAAAFAGGRAPSGLWSRPPTWLRAYRTALSRRGAGALALDPTTRRLFLASGGGGPGYGAGGPASLDVLDADSLAMIRSLPLPTGVAALALDPRASRLFVLDDAGVLSTLDSRTLAQLGSRPIGHGAAQLAIDARTGRVFVLDAATGTVTTVDGRGGGTVAVARIAAGASGLQVDERTGHVFVEGAGGSGLGLLRATGGSVSMLDAASGRVLRTIAVGPLPLGAALDGPQHRLFVGSFAATAAGGSGRLQILDTARGTLLRTVAVPALPFSLAVDPGQGRVVVAGGGVAAPPVSSWASAIERVRRVLGPAPPTPTPTPAAGPGGGDTGGTLSVVATAR